MATGKENANSYRSILKGTSMLGGVQVLQVLISLIRGKFVALFLGPDGMGINSLFNSSSMTISQVANLGLNMAIVKETASAKEDPESLAHVAKVALTLLKLTAACGALLCVLLSPWLSIITFGSSDFQWQFMLLGLVIYLMISSAGKASIIQGLHKIKLYSRATIIGSLSGLLFGVPLYYFFGVKGIVPAMAMIYVSMEIYYSICVRRIIPGNRTRFAWQSHKKIAVKMVRMGLVLMSSSMIATLCTYLLNIAIRSFGDFDDVGLYNAANSLTNQYSSMVFTAMSMDYFPRLAEAAKENGLMLSIVNRQMEIVAYLIAPMAIAVITMAPLIIRVLLTESFISVVPLVRWMGLGILLKAISFPIGYIAFAKDNKRLFFWLEGIVTNILFIGMAVLGYYFFGLIGLGYAMVCENILVIAIYYTVNACVYGYRVNSSALTACGIAIITGLTAFLCSFIPDGLWSATAMSAILAISACISIFKLKRLLKSDERSDGNMSE